MKFKKSTYPYFRVQNNSYNDKHHVKHISKAKWFIFK